MKTRTSWLAAILQFIGYGMVTITTIALIVAAIGFKKVSSEFDPISWLAYGGVCAAIYLAY